MNLVTKFKLIINTHNHGGARKGAGRKKNSGRFKEDTKVIRVPISLVESILPSIEVYKSQIKTGVEAVSYTHLTLPTKA